MNKALIVLQILVAIALLISSAVKLLTPIDQLVGQMGWLAVAPLPSLTVTLIGILEMMGALGLILPWVTGIQPQLVQRAALGITVMMVGAVAVHILMGDSLAVMSAPLVIGSMAAFIAFGRTKIMPVSLMAKQTASA